MGNQDKTKSDTKILIVDDEIEIGKLLCNLLHEYTVETVTTGELAIARVNEKSFDLVLIDYFLPGINGLELVKKIQQIDNHCALVLTTGQPSVDLTVDAIRSGVLGFLNKPFHRADVLAEIKRVIDHQNSLLASVRESEWQAERFTTQVFESTLENLRMAYQPIYRVGRTMPMGVEALLRSDVSNFVGPEACVSMAKSLNRLEEFSLKVQKNLASDLKCGDLQGLLFINLDPDELQCESLYRLDSPLLAASSSIVLEITERTHISDDVLLERTRLLRDLGYRIALDDMGAGYASLNNLALLSPDFIKLDMALIHNLEEHKIQKDIVRSLLNLADKLNTPVICEGVETQQEYDCLANLGVEYMQGYLLGRPEFGLQFRERQNSESSCTNMDAIKRESEPQYIVGELNRPNNKYAAAPLNINFDAASLFETAPISIAIVATNGKIAFANEAFRTYHRLGDCELSHMFYWDLFESKETPPCKRIFGRLTQSNLPSCNTCNTVGRAVRHNGMRRYIDVCRKSDMNGADEFLVVYEHDGYHI